MADKGDELTVGKGETWGDGITPVEVAHLDGAENLVLDGGLAFALPDVFLAWIGYLH